MALNLKTFWDSVTNLIDKNNTTTSSYDISSGLNERVKTVDSTYISRSMVPNILYPLIHVELVSKEEEFGMLGNSARRQMNIDFNVYAVVDYGMGQYQGGKRSEEEMVVLSQNIEALLRAYPQLSQTSLVLQSEIESVNYGVTEDNDTYNVGAAIKLNTTVWSD